MLKQGTPEDARKSGHSYKDTKEEATNSNADGDEVENIITAR